MDRKNTNELRKCLHRNSCFLIIRIELQTYYGEVDQTKRKID